MLHLWKFTSSFLIIILYCTYLCCVNITDGKHIQKRYLQFPLFSSMGYIVALAVPLDLGSRNVFVSFTFEANYVLPSAITNNVPPWINGTAQTWPEKRNLINRKSIYRLVKERLRSYGYSGRYCLLKMICEISDDPIDEHNGVLGDLVQFILTPSASRNEKLTAEYYVSEERGKNGTGCLSYHQKCPKNVFKLFMEYAQ